MNPPYALAVAQHIGTEHHELRVTSKDALNVIPDLPEFTMSLLQTVHKSQLILSVKLRDRK
jgi:asparagine synthetase B (glutamine-hydrolysing)